MSFAMDELGNSYGIDTALKAKIVSENKTVEKTAEVKPEDAKSEKTEASDVFESIKQKQNFAQVFFQDVQEQSTATEITSAALQKFADHVADIKQNVKSNSSEEDKKKNIDENYQKIAKTAQETKFNDTPLVEEKKTSEQTLSLEELKIPDIKKIKVDTPENIQAASDKLDEISNNISQKQTEIAIKHQELIKSVNENSLVEIKPSEPAVISVEEKEKTEKKEQVKIQTTKEESPEQLKKSTIDNIYDSPQKSVKMHIKHIDRNLLLAMISLRAG